MRFSCKLFNVVLCFIIIQLNFSLGQILRQPNLSTVSTQNTQTISHFENSLGVNATCGAAELHRHTMVNDAQYAAKMNQFEQLVQQQQLQRNGEQARSGNRVYQIPVVVHLINSGDARTDVSDDEIRTAIQGLNEVMRKVPGVAFNNTGVDMEVEFALAVRDPNGNCTNGITRYDLSGNASYRSMGINYDGVTSGYDLNTIHQNVRWDTRRYYNIYLVNYIGGPNGGTAGFAYLAGSHGAAFDGTVMLATHLKQRYSGTLIHELGHAFNLYHTFDGDNDGQSCPSNDDCTTQGDRVCDTPPHRRSTSYLTSCQDIANPCDNGSSSTLHAYNFMDYSPCGMQQFTPGQKVRYRQSLELIRTSFLPENGNMSLVPVSISEPIAGFTGSTFCAGAAIQLFDETPCIPNLYLEGRVVEGLSFRWEVTNGTQTYVSTDQNPTFTGLPVGTYNVQFSVNSGQVTGTTNYTGAFVIQSPVASTGCVPLSYNMGTFSYNISKVKFNTIENASHATQTVGYSSYECSHTTFVEAGATYNLELTTNTRQNIGSPNYEVLIDWNGDGVLDLATERVSFGALTPLTQGQVTIVPITIPVTAVTNQVLRFRVGMYSESLTTAMRNCQFPVTISETEDYGVFVTNKVARVSIAASPGTNVSSTTNVTFSATPVNGGTSPQYVWYRNGNVVVGESGPSLVVSGLQNGEVFYAKMYSNLPNVLLSPASSNSLTMSVYGPPVTAFSHSSNTIGCAGLTVNYTDESTFEPTSWSWSFPGGTPSSSTLRNPVVVYNTPGVHSATLVTSNQHGVGATVVRNNLIEVLNTTPSTCVNYTRQIAPGNYGIGITKIQLSNVNSTSTANDNVYIDNTCSQVAQLIAGESYQLIVGTSGLNSQWYKAYIDYDNNGTFNEANELILNSRGKILGDTILFTVPQSATTNRLLRLRVISDFVNTNPGSNSCFTNLQYGQAEDIGVYISPETCIVPVVSSQPVSRTICEGENTSFTASVSGNLLTHQWQISSNGGTNWSNLVNNTIYSGVQSLTLGLSRSTNDLNQNIYRLVSSNGCGEVVTSSATLIVNTIPVASSITANGPLSFCQGGSVVLTSGQSSGVVWSNGATTPTITISTSGNYSYTVTQNSCSATSSPVTVIVNAYPVASAITANGPLSFCQGGLVVLTSGQASGVVWSNGATTPTITVSTSGSYSYTVTQNSCSATSSPVIVTVNAIPVVSSITANGPLSFCEGGSVVLSSGQSSGVVWSNGATTPTITVSTSGSYSYTVTQNSCSATSSPVSVTVNAIPVASVITANGPLSFCEGGSVVLSSGQSSGVVWSNGATTPTITVSTSGNYSYTVTQNSCSATSSPVTVIVNASPVASTITASGPLSFCEGGSVVLSSGQASGVVWSNGAITPTIAVSTSGSYSYTVTQNSCSATSSPVSVTVNAIPVASVITANGPLSFCEGGSVVLTSGQSSGVVWSNGATTPTITVSTSGSYSYTVTQNSCSAQSEGLDVTVFDMPVVTLDEVNLLCDYHDELTLEGGLPLGGVFAVEGTPSLTFNPTRGAGNYELTYTVIGDNECLGIATVVIEVSECLSLSDISKESFKVYPNPTISTFEVTGDQVVGFERMLVIDATGRQIQEVIINGVSLSVDCSSWANGSYTLHFIGREFNEIRKLNKID